MTARLEDPGTPTIRRLVVCCFFKRQMFKSVILDGSSEPLSLDGPSWILDIAVSRRRTAGKTAPVDGSVRLHEGLRCGDGNSQAHLDANDSDARYGKMLCCS